MSVSNSPPEDSATVFGALKAHFPTPNQDNKIKTQDFLDASAGVVIIVEKIGKVFAPVVYDMNGNIKKITEKFQEDKENYEFIEDMILRQKSSGDMIVVDALQWLRRALHFFSRFFQLIIADSDCRNITQDLSPFIKNAYRETLERYHGWLGSQLFNILSRFVPNRRELFYTLALDKDNKDEHVLRDMKVFSQNLTACVQKLMNFYREHDLESNERV